MLWTALWSRQCSCSYRQNQPLVQLVKDCLHMHNIPSWWPSTEQVLQVLVQFKATFEDLYGKFSKKDAVKQVVMMRLSEAEMKLSEQTWVYCEAKKRYSIYNSNWSLDGESVLELLYGFRSFCIGHSDPLPQWLFMYPLVLFTIVLICGEWWLLSSIPGTKSTLTPRLIKSAVSRKKRINKYSKGIMNSHRKILNYTGKTSMWLYVQNLAFYIKVCLHCCIF